METPLSPFSPKPKNTAFEDFILRYQFWIIAILVVFLLSGIYLMITPPATSLADDPQTIPTDELGSTDTTTTPADPTGQIVVDIAGAVVKPGVYFLPTGSIVEDGIKTAGGFNKFADLDLIAKTINRAESVESHSKIYIPKKGDNLALLTPTQNPSTGSTNNSFATPSAKININTASVTELDLLPGIGPVTAQRIVDYRLQNGDFKTPDDIKNVPGLGDSKFESLKDLITI